MSIEGEQPGGQPSDDELQAMWNEEAATRAGDNPAEGELTESKTTDAPAADEGSPPSPAATPAAPAPPSAEERLALLEQRLQGMDGTMRSTAGRVAAMQRDMATADAARKAAGDAPTKAAIDAAKGSLDKWDALKEDFPEWAEAMEQRLASLAPQAAPAPAPTIDKEGLKAELRREMEQDLIVEKYPDWRATAQTNEFQKWFKAQPAEFQAKAESERGRDVIQVLDRFNEAKTKSVTDIRQTRQSKLDAAAGVATPGRPAPRVKDESEMTEQEIWDQEARRLAAKKQRAG